MMSAAAAAKSLQSHPTLCDPIDGSPPGSPSLGFSRGCHFLLQCMKVKSESEVAQSYLTPSNPMDCSLPGPSIHGIFQARALEWGAIAITASILCNKYLVSLLSAWGHRGGYQSMKLCLLHRVATHIKPSWPFLT